MKNTIKIINTKQKSKSRMSKFFDNLLNLLFPKNIKCILCGEELNKNSKYSICEDCLSSLPFIINSCPRCSTPITDNNQGVCQNCKINNYHFRRAFAVLEYNETMSRFIHKLKYGGAKYSIEPIANLLINKLATLTENFDYITYIPMFKKKEKSRGYNQSKILAEYVSEKSNIEIVPFCYKQIDNLNQASLDYKARKENVKDVYSFDKQYKEIIQGKTILIIDDIMTTGSTIDEISKVLINAGAKECYALVLCHGKMESIPTDATSN